MALKIQRKRGININKVVTKVVISLLALYVGGTIVREIGLVMENTSSPFYQGLTLIGWTVATATNVSSTSDCGTLGGGNTIQNCITSTSGSGILAVIGIIAIASIVTEFVEFSM